MTEELMDEYRAWAASRPARVQAVLAKLDGWTVYRMKHNDGTYGGAFYILASVDEPKDDSAPCTVKVDRYDAESGLPMWRVFGVDPDKLEAVGPGQVVDGCLRVATAQ